LEVRVKRLKGCLAPGAWAIVASLLVVMPAAAAGADELRPAPRQTKSLTTLSAATLKTLRSPADAQTPSSGSDSDTSFFKTKKGAAVIVLIAAGFGYALYSKSHDRVKSPIR
jgi:hypothetical protein